MSYLEYTVRHTPTGARKLFYFNWPLIILVCAVASVGFLMLYSVGGGSWSPWALAQMQRFGLGLTLMFIVALIPIWFWRNTAGVAYIVSLILLLIVEVMGDVGGGSQRWIDLGFMRLQPSELAKITLVMLLAAYYDWLPPEKISKPFWIIVPLLFILLPVILVLRQPDLGTSLLLIMGGGMMLWFAGVHWGYFAGVITAGIATIAAVFYTRGTDNQLLSNYQYDRIETFLDPSADPLGTGYHITQSKIALGSGGWTGRGYMQGSQSQLNFLPEKHTDFIFTTLAEEFGFVGAISLLVLYGLILIFCMVSALQMRDRFASLVTLGIGWTFFLYFAVNMGMVMGLLPVVGVPLPLVSYGGSAMLVLMVAFGVVQSAHIHRAR